MPFDPRIIAAEEPPLDDSGQLVLPDDLAELAAQLGDDAWHLSACYPASPSSQVAALATKSISSGNANSILRRMIPALTAAAMVTGLLAVVGSWRWLREGSDEPRERPTVAEVVNDDATSPQRKIAGDGVRSPTEAASVPTTPGLPPSPAFFLQEYSGPELEGIYDLLGESGDDKISI